MLLYYIQMGRTAKNRNRNRNKNKKGGLFGVTCTYPSILRNNYSQNIFSILLSVAHYKYDGYITGLVKDVYGGRACENYNTYFLLAYKYAYDKFTPAELNDFYTKSLKVDATNFSLPKYKEHLKTFVDLLMEKDKNLKELAKKFEQDNTKPENTIIPVLTTEVTEQHPCPPCPPCPPVPPVPPTRNPGELDVLRRPGGKGGKFRRSKSSKNKTKRRHK